MSKIKKYISRDGTIRIASVISTDLVNEAFRFREASPLVKTLMGRALTGVVLMASQMKEGLSLGVHFVGDGPVQEIFAEARYEGKAKVYAGNRAAELSPTQIHIGAGLGTGHIEVVRSLPFQKDPHRGTVHLLTGEIAEDIAYYLQQSQQIPCIVALSTIPQEKGVEFAGGYILELMPGFTDETLTKLESLQPLVGSITQKLKDGADAEDLIGIYLDSFDFQEIEHPYDLSYVCGCSMERVERSLLLLGPTVLDEMIESREQTQVQCEFCGCEYQVDEKQLLSLRKSLDVKVH